MRIIPLGGAEEIGASCTLVEIGGRRLVVDCGIRTSAAGAADPLPNLSVLDKIDAVIVTHAHLDHTGALPVLHQAFPLAPVYATAATHALIRVMLSDALKVMANRNERENEVPLYSAEAVASLLTRAVPLEFCRSVALFGGDVAVTMFPAGHVLGAAMVGLEAADGSVLLTGDYSVSPQRTVEGLLAPRFKPDVLVTESTYGDRLHANRRVEERRLADTVAEVVEGGGKALIPAFALGRAQEIILILQQFQRDGAIPRFPVWVDGMVKNICGVYSSYGEVLARDLRRRMEREGKVFFREKDGFNPVIAPQRDAVAAGNPCAIITSSGMLTGGPSLFYAKRIAADRKSAILITGYQDEESPGRRLLDLASAEPTARRLVIEGETVNVDCRVDKYGLSAHADSGEMAGLAASLGAREVVLVHGQDDARARLAALMNSASAIHMPRACDELAFKARRRARTFVAPHVKGLGYGRPLDETGLAALRATLVEEGRGQALFTAEELAQRWFGTAATEEQLQGTRDVLALRSPYFTPDARRPFLYRPSKDQQLFAALSYNDKKAEKLEDEFPFNQARALEVATALFEGASDLYKKGAYLENHKLVLYFHFPQIAEVRYAKEIEALKQQTGWEVEVWPEAHLAVLNRTVEEMLPGDWRLAKAPSYYREERRMKLKLHAASLERERVEALSRDFEARTGVALLIETAGPGTPLPAIRVARGGQPMEINSAFAEVDRVLRPLGLIKRGLKRDGTGQFIELTWISPQAAEPHREAIEGLARDIGWSMRVNPEPNQTAIKERARLLAPAAWNVVRDPAFLKDRRCVRMKARGPADAETVARLSSVLFTETGYTLDVEWE